VDISLSNFGDGALPVGSKVAWSILLNGKPIKTGVATTVVLVPQGELGVVGSIEFVLPDVGSTTTVPYSVTDGAKSITVTAQFVPGSSFAAAVPANSWNTTLYPRWVDSPTPTSSAPLMATDPELVSKCGFSDCKLSPLEPTATGPRAVFMTRHVNDALLQRVAKGSVVVLLQNTTSKVFPSAATRFKQAWWLGSATDNVSGLQVQ
jgi:hypothetical protein